MNSKRNALLSFAKRLTVFLMLAVCFMAACAMMACDDGDDGEGEEQLPTFFEVSFDLNNGRADDGCEGDFDNQTLEKGELAVIPASNPIRDGYSFKGWLNSNGDSFDFNQKIEKNTKIKAGWTAFICVTFDLDEGSGEGDYSAQTFLSGLKAEEPKEPQKTEHTFNGWIDDGGDIFDFDRAVSSSQTLVIALKANWKPIEYGLLYYIDGTLDYSETYVKSNKSTLLRTPKKDGYILDCWYASAELKGEKQAEIPAFETGDKKFYARWLAVITVEFDFNNGIDGIIEQKIASGGTVSLFENPETDGYIFIEWIDKDGNPFDFDTVFESDKPITVRLTARWTALITVKFDVSDSDSDPQDFLNQVILSGEKATRPALDPVLDGFIFKHWVDAGGEEFDFEAEICSDTPLDLILYPDWYDTVQDVTVSFDLNGGDFTSENEHDFDAQTLSQGEKAAAPASIPLRDGYAFKGWFLNNSAFDFDSSIYEDTVICAAWNAWITVKFYLNNGEENYPDKLIESGEKAVKPDFKPSKDGYFFKEWLDQDGKPFNFDEIIISESPVSVKIYAQWSAIITVIFDLDGGEADSNFDSYLLVSDKGYFVEPTDEPQRDGYVFNGWTVDPAYILDGNQNWESIIISSDIPLTITVKAKWLALLKITFDLNGGYDEIDYPPQTIKQGESVLEPPNPQKENCDFTGWYTDKSGNTQYLFGFDTALNKDITLYAGWKPIESGFEFIFEDGRWAVALGQAVPDNDGKLVIPEFNPANGERITAIAAQGFSRGDRIAEIKEVYLPDSIESIGEWAFYKCTALKAINLPDGLKYLNRGAFGYCYALKSIIIPALTEMGQQIFYGCTSLYSVSFDEKFNITSLPNSTFTNCEELTSVKLPPCLIKLGDNVFTGCIKLENLVIPSLVTHIGADAFSNSGLKKIILPQGLLRIGAENDSGVFKGCFDIKHIFIPSTVQFIGEYAFSGWNLTQTIHIQGTTKGWDPYWNKNSNAATHNDCDCGSFEEDSFVATFIATPPDNSNIPTAYLIAAQGQRFKARITKKPKNTLNPSITQKT